MEARFRAPLVSLLAAGWIAVSLVGCDQAKPLVLAPVDGIVMYKGQPVRNALVEFVQPGSPVRSCGITDEDGAFSITSFNPDDGAPVGRSKILVRKLSVARTSRNEQQPVDLTSISDPTERRQASISNLELETPPSLRGDTATTEGEAESALPSKYTSLETSDLEADVIANQQNSIEVMLVD
jgi:hypothetical protein